MHNLVFYALKIYASYYIYANILKSYNPDDNSSFFTER